MPKAIGPTLALGPTLSVTELFAEREGRRRRDMAAEKQLRRRKEEEFADYRRRLDGGAGPGDHLAERAGTAACRSASTATWSPVNRRAGLVRALAIGNHIR
jgi:hypothetical protein